MEIHGQMKKRKRKSKKLPHDRNIEIPIDPMDIDEINLILEMANIQNVRISRSISSL